MIPDARHAELKEAYERYASMVHARCRSILGSEDEAWDATQEVFIKLAKSLPGIRKKESLYSWLISAGTHYCISQLRKRRSVELDEQIHGADSGDAEQERRLALKRIISGLLLPWGRKVREVVVYAYVYGYRQDEIAQLTGMGGSTVRKYLTKFKRGSQGSKERIEEELNG